MKYQNKKKELETLYEKQKREEMDYLRDKWIILEEKVLLEKINQDIRKNFDDEKGKN